MPHCLKCGTEIADSDKFCGECGVSLENTKEPIAASAGAKNTDSTVRGNEKEAKSHRTDKTTRKRTENSSAEDEERNLDDNQLASADVETGDVSRSPTGQAHTPSQSERGFIDKIAPATSWLAASFMVYLAGATITESVAGMPVRTALGTAVYIALAIFVAPPTRDYLQGQYGMSFSRGFIVVVVIMTPLFNEGFITPPIS